MRNEEEGRRAAPLDLTGSHHIFYLTSTIHLQSIHLVIQKEMPRLMGCGSGLGERDRDRDRKKQEEEGVICAVHA